jgi:GNAT superfamily N-acetyltransferase
VEVRAAAEADVPELARLWREFGAYYAQLDPERFRIPADDGLEEWIAAGLRLESSRWLVAEVDGQVAGYAGGQIIEPHENADFKMLTDAAKTRLGINVVQTSASFGRRGVATALLQALEEWGRSRGAELVLAETAVDSPVAIPFWDQADGYARTSVRFRKRLR